MNYSNTYYLLRLIRSVEEKIIELYPSDIIKSPVHLSIGSEASSVAVCQTLQKEDCVTGNYRGHALYLAKTQGNQEALNQMFGELYGKVNGVAGGRAGSMHLFNKEWNFISSSAIVASTISHGCGIAYAQKYKKQPLITVSFFGDGSMDEGVTMEVLNFASLYKLPILFLLENNGVAVHTFQKERMAGNVKDRIEALKIPYQHVKSTDMDILFDTASYAAYTMRHNLSGPYFIEVECPRYLEHVGINTDWHLGYRKESDLKYWKEHDPLITLPQQISKLKLIEIHEQVHRQIEEAVKLAEAAPFPYPKTLMEHVW